MEVKYIPDWEPTGVGRICDNGSFKAPADVELARLATYSGAQK